MGRWLDLANSMEEGKGPGDNRDNRDDSSVSGANVSNVPNVPPPPAREMLRDWERGVASLDLTIPLGGFPLDRWRRIVRDCDNLIADFGKGAATMGWSTIDLFGFDIDGGNIGGLVHRIDGGRIITLDEALATYRWPFSDRTSRFARDYIGHLPISFVPVWELKQ